jgi:penicillin-binding protein 1A
MNGFKPTSGVVDGPVCIGNWCPHNYSGGFSGAMTLTQALVRSINVIPVKLSISLGDGNAKIGRAKIIDIARKAGLRTPLPDSTSLPIGAAEVTVLDHTAGYTMFPNAGKAMAPHAILEVRSSAGEPIWRYDRDAKKPVQVLRPQVAMDMNVIMNKVVEEGTGRRAILDGVKAAGKTGTTNAYRDAWFVGFTGNYVAGVWAGNDDYAPTNRMTGGSLPAMIWKQIMSYAHQGIEIKPIPGVAPGPTPPATPVAVIDANASVGDTLRPTVLTRRAVDALVRIERIFDEAARAQKPAGAAILESEPRAPAFASTSERKPSSTIRGN